MGRQPEVAERKLIRREICTQNDFDNDLAAPYLRFWCNAVIVLCLLNDSYHWGS